MELSSHSIAYKQSCINPRRSEHALQQELKQVHDIDVFVPVRESSLTTKPKREVLLSTVTFMKEKRDNLMKRGVCADKRT